MTVDFRPFVQTGVVFGVTVSEFWNGCGALARKPLHMRLSCQLCLDLKPTLFLFEPSLENCVCIQGQAEGIS